MVTGHILQNCQEAVANGLMLCNNYGYKNNLNNAHQDHRFLLRAAAAFRIFIRRINRRNLFDDPCRCNVRNSQEVDLGAIHIAGTYLAARIIFAKICIAIESVVTREGDIRLVERRLATPPRVAIFIRFVLFSRGGYIEDIRRWLIFGRVQ